MPVRCPTKLELVLVRLSFCEAGRAPPPHSWCFVAWWPQSLSECLNAEVRRVFHRQARGLDKVCVAYCRNRCALGWSAAQIRPRIVIGFFLKIEDNVVNGFLVIGKQLVFHLQQSLGNTVDEFILADEVHHIGGELFCFDFNVLR